MDDGRRWWQVDTELWGCPQFVAAPSGRAAIAALRRDVIAAERANGMSRRDAVVFVRAGRFTAGGPMSTGEAFAQEFGWLLAFAICDARRQREVPLSPASVEDCGLWVSPERVARMRDQLLVIYGLKSPPVG